LTTGDLPKETKEAERTQSREPRIARITRIAIELNPHPSAFVESVVILFVIAFFVALGWGTPPPASGHDTMPGPGIPRRMA